VRSVEVGSNVADFHPGDIVSGKARGGGRCVTASRGRRHLCAHTQGVGVDRAGALPNTSLPVTNVWRHSQHVASEIAANFLTPRQCGTHSTLVPGLGEDVLITGAGPIGIMAQPSCAMPEPATSWSRT